jgi:CHAT domain-containing protein
MTLDPFESFAKDMALLRQSWKRAPFVLFIGNAAAPEIRSALIAKVLEEHKDASGSRRSRYDVEQAFRGSWARTSKPVRDALFCSAMVAAEATHPEEMKQVADGYGHLAQLAKQGYFDVILTTHADCLLEQAFHRVLEYHDWRVLRVGIDPPEEIVDHVVPRTRRVVSVVKLQGDAKRGLYPLGEEQRAHLGAVEKALFANPMLLVGYDDNADQDVLGALANVDTPAYLAAAATPDPNGALKHAIQRADPKFIVGDMTLFRRLAATVIGAGPGDSAAVKVLADRGMPLSRVPDEKLDDMIKNPARRPEDLVEILHAIRAEAPTRPDAVSFTKRVIITLSLDDRARSIAFRSEGDLVHAGTAELWSPLDTEGYTRLVRLLGQDLERARATGDASDRKAWRDRQEWGGRRLHDSLVCQIRELMDLLGTARNVTLDNGELLICFDGPRHLLGMPYELLEDEHGPWAVRYPMFRTVRSVVPRAPGFRALLDGLKQHQQRLRVLLVGAESAAHPAVAQHLRLLKRALEDRAKELRFALAPPETLILPAGARALTELEDRLTTCDHHVVFYEGCSAQSDVAGETGLVIGNPPRILTEHRLCEVLRQAPPSLVFFNTVIGARTGGEHLLHNPSCLGIMDAAVQAGVSVVVGHRWSVPDPASVHLAKVFLEKLLETRSPPLAMQLARADAWQLDPFDQTWASPVLVAQQVD